MADNRTIELAGREIALVVRRSPRARRVAVRIPVSDNSVELVLPSRAPESDGMDFLRSRANWILERLDRLPRRVPFVDGAEIPLWGAPHRLRWMPGGGPPVIVDGKDIVVSGRPEHMARRVGDWLRAEAKRRITPMAHDKAAKIGARIARITVRDQKSRWGSCAPGSRLSFSWRLVLAPNHVMDYVVAHEIAHIVEANHSPSFWRIVDDLTADRRSGRAWLRRHGLALHRYG